MEVRTFSNVLDDVFAEARLWRIAECMIYYENKKKVRGDTWNM